MCPNNPVATLLSHPILLFRLVLHYNGKACKYPQCSRSYHGNHLKSVVMPQAKLPNRESVRFSSSGESLTSGDMVPSTSGRGSQTESFINKMINLLSCENEFVGVNIREGVKELVSGELSPVVYPYLFQGLQEELGRIYKPDHNIDVVESNTVFVDQVRQKRYVTYLTAPPTGGVHSPTYHGQ